MWQSVAVSRSWGMVERAVPDYPDAVHTTERMTTIYEHLGPHLIEAAVDGLYKRILADPLLTPFFAHMDVVLQRRRMTAFLLLVTGGPSGHRLADMRRAHDRPVSQGMTDVHFDRVEDHLVAELRSLTVPEHLIAEMGALVESVRNDVLHRRV